MHVIHKCKTTTYQKSNLIRSTRVWNTLANDLSMNMDNLNSFKSVVLQCYFISSDYDDCDNPRIFKTMS